MGFRFVDATELIEPSLGWEVRIPATVQRKSELLRRYAAALRFPDYFGSNWDALEECLRDLSWLDGPGRLRVIHEALPLARQPRSLQIYLRLLHDVMIDVPGRNGRDMDVIFPKAFQSLVSKVLQGEKDHGG